MAEIIAMRATRGVSPQDTPHFGVSVAVNDWVNSVHATYAMM